MKGYTPQKYIDVNITGGLNILEFAAKVRCQRVVFTQSISDVAYLCGSPEPINAESMSLFPLDNDHSVYSITKTAACNLLQHYSERFGFRYYVLRFPNIYLYHPNPYYYVDGERRWQGYRLMIEKAIKGEPLEVWGNPNKVRDIVYVKDAAQIIWRTLSIAEAPSGMYNVGTGVGTSMLKQVEGIAEVFSGRIKKSQISLSPHRPDTTEYVFDISKTKKNLGYEPQYDYIEYLKDFKQEMELERFHKLWGVRKDFL